jgi:hypothetical protein
MELLLDRDVRTKNSTIGQLYVDGKFECYIIEDYDRGLKSTMELSVVQSIKVKAETAIPTGRYEVIITFSNRFQRNLPELLNVKGFEKIRMHSGNSKSDTEGCLLTGTERSIDFVGNSRVAFGALMPKLEKAIKKGEKIFITVKD